MSMDGTRRRVATLVGTALLIAATSSANDGLSTNQIRRLLVAADIVAWEPIGAGVTGAWRVTLSNGTMTHDAAFQPVDLTRRGGGEGRKPVVDSFRHSIAADRLAELVGRAQLGRCRGFPQRPIATGLRLHPRRPLVVLPVSVQPDQKVARWYLSYTASAAAST